MLAVTRLIVAFIILAMAATVLGTGIGYQQAWQSDERLLVEQHAALRIRNIGHLQLAGINPVGFLN